MAIALKDTLLDLELSEDDVEAHVLQIIQARPPAPNGGRPSATYDSWCSGTSKT